MNAIDDVAKLLGAASQSPDRSVRIVYLAEARVILARESDRIIELRLLLDGLEAEVVRTTAPTQLKIGSVGP